MWDFLVTPFALWQQDQFIMMAILIAAISLMIGSFLNVVIYRLPLMMENAEKAEAREALALAAEPAKPFNLATPSSTCPHCHTPIRFWQNIPVLSFLFLRGRCAYCKTAISWRYPAIELLTLLAAIVVVMQTSSLLQTIPLLLLTYVFIALMMIDYDHYLLPDQLTLPLLWAGLLLNSQGVLVSLQAALWGAVCGYLSLWSVFWLFKLITGKEGMGYGDFKLLAVCGAWFGALSLPNTILLSSVVGAVWGVLLIVAFKREQQKPMPFGPFLILAAWLGYFFPAWFNLTQWLAF